MRLTYQNRPVELEVVSGYVTRGIWLDSGRVLLEDQLTDIEQMFAKEIRLYSTDLDEWIFGE